MENKGNCLSYIFYVVAADDMVMQGARAAAVMVFRMFSQNILGPFSVSCSE